MWGLNKTGDVVTLAELVAEGFAGTVGALVDMLAERGDAIDVDGHGRLAVAAAVAETLRRERAEAERLSAQEAAEAAALAAERAARVREEQEAADAAWRVAEEAKQRRLARIRRLEAAAGCNVILLEGELRRSLLLAPDSGGSFADRQRIEDKAFSLDELERFVAEQNGVASIEDLEEVGR